MGRKGTQTTNRMVATQETFQERVKRRMDCDHYRAGYEAFLAGRRFKTPEGMDQQNRLGWFEGYLDAQYPEDRYKLPEYLTRKKTKRGK